jgi:hypothetical protein
MRISVPAASAFCDKHPLIRLREIVKQFAGIAVVHSSPEGNLDFQIFAAMSAAITTFTVAAALRSKCVVEPEFQECVFLRVRDEVDAAAVAAIAAAGAAPRYELLSSESYRTVPAVAGLYGDFCFIDERGLFTRRVG